MRLFRACALIPRFSFAAFALVAAAACSSAPGDGDGETVGTTSAAVDMICGKPASATLDGFPAYPYCGNFNVYTDNGVDTRSTGGAGWTQTEGGYGYQCVEWAVRYFYFKWNVPHGWFVAYAKDMCTTYPATVTKTSTPVHGDLAVFKPGCGGADATAGHVAAINTVASSTIQVVQENPAGTGTWQKSCVMCYLHAASNKGPPPPDAGSDAAPDAHGDAAGDGAALGDAAQDTGGGPPPPAADADTDAGGDWQSAPSGSSGGCEVAPQRLGGVGRCAGGAGGAGGAAGATGVALGALGCLALRRRRRHTRSPS